MRGSKPKKRGNSWFARIDVGIDPGTGRRKQLTITESTKRKVEDQITKFLGDVRRGEYVDPSKLTFGEWSETWFSTYVESRKSQRTIETYRSVLDLHIKPALSSIRLQQLEPEHIEEYYFDKQETLAQSTLEQHSAIIFNILKLAQRKKKILVNPAELVENKPKSIKTENQEAEEHCWEEFEVRG